MRNLLLTLGHNSSAVLVENGRLVWGLETERVSGLKSDSRFPQAVIDYVGGVKPDMVYVSHWAPNGSLGSMSPKHWHPHAFDGVPVRTLGVDLSHHDAHMHGALCYAGKGFPREGSFCMVVDGFGTFGEHFSVYDMKYDTPKLIKRVHGYDTSLGLWYQYATAFMGLKMHEDEYKLLGYEVNVPHEYLCDELTSQALTYADEWIHRMSESKYRSKYDPMYDLTALANVKDMVWSHLKEVCLKNDVPDPTSPGGRAALAFYVQAVLENVVCTLASTLGARNLLLSGGCFYNVKLNKLLVDQTPGKVCVYPLAGDQGNGVGLYAHDHPEFRFPDDLNWGPRLLENRGAVPNMTICKEYKAYSLVMDKISEHGYCNLVRGAAEFGPRAMCNTSTLALPSSQLVSLINHANERNTVMPMAPVVTRKQYYDLFKNTEKVHRSEEHMVVALEYKHEPVAMGGISHEYRYPRLHWTGRPQVARSNDDLMHELLLAFDSPLINTSFNFHGKPIALGMESIIENHMMQYKRDSTFHTVVVTNGQ